MISTLFLIAGVVALVLAGVVFFITSKSDEEKKDREDFDSWGD